MKQKDRSLLYLLTFTMLLLSFSSIFAAVTVTYNDKTLPYHRTGETITATVVVTDNPIISFDLVTKVTSTFTDAFGHITAISIAPPIPGAVIDLTRADNSTEDFSRVWGFDLDPLVVMMPIGTYVFTFTVNTNCHIGKFTFDDGEWVIDPDMMTLETTGFVNGLAEYEPLTLTPGTYTVINEDPVITNCPDDGNLDACEVYTHDFDATDPDEQFACATQNLTWSLVDPPTGASIDDVTGELTYDPPPVLASLGAKLITVVVTDEFLATDQCVFTITVLNDAPVITSCPDDGDLDACLVYTYQFAATDPNICGDLVWSLVDAPDGAIIDEATGELTYDPPTDPASLGDKVITVVVTDEFEATDECEFTITVFNDAPVFVDCPTAALQMYGCTTKEQTFTATDPNKCVALAFSLVAPVPTGATITTAGVLTYDPPDAQATGLVAFKVKVVDEFGAFALCNFNIMVKADAPIFTVCNTPETEIPVLWGNTLTGDVDAIDPDAGPLPLVYTLLDFDGPVTAGLFEVNSTNGAYSWPTTFGDLDYTGEFEATIEVFDGCKADTCTFNVYVTHHAGVSAEIWKLHGVIQGHYAFVPVDIYTGGLEMGGFDLLIGYDASALTLNEVLPGAQISDPTRWEYFTYRFGATGNCNGPCPSGLVRIVAIADMNNGIAHPVEAAYLLNGTVATLKFLVTNNRTFECQFVPLGFYWIDCTDNVLSSKDGQQAYIADQIWYYTGDDWPDEELIRIDNAVDSTSWGGYAGWKNTLDPYCLVAEQGKPMPLDIVNFYDGGIDIACADSIDLRGDINLNGIANEIADAVIYTQYFLIGITAFPEWTTTSRQGAIAASDVNADGKPLTVGDLVYLLRIIVGDALPYAKFAPYSSNADISVLGDMISIQSSETIGALYLTFNVTGDFTLVNHTNMEVLSNRVGDKLNVLVYSGMTSLSNAIPAGTNELLTVTGAQLNSVEASDYYGNLLNVRVQKSALPTQFSLSQNVPNPFNPTTKIGLDLPSFTSWQIDIYNVNGQLVQSYNGTNIGHVEVTWDATNAASGIYFYKVTADSFTDTKKMVLMK